MALEITYSQARATLAKLLDEVTQDREIVIIKRRDGEDAALIAADTFGITESPTLNISSSVSGPSPVIVLRSGLSGKIILVCIAWQWFHSVLLSNR